MRILALALMLSTACTTTRYVAANGNANFSFERMPENYRMVRNASAVEWESYFIFGLASAQERQDLGRMIPLQNNERCVNLEITNSIGPAQGGVMTLLMILTGGVSSIIWQTRQTQVSCDIVAPAETKTAQVK